MGLYNLVQRIRGLNGLVSGLFLSHRVETQSIASRRTNPFTPLIRCTKWRVKTQSIASRRTNPFIPLIRCTKWRVET